MTGFSGLRNFIFHSETWQIIVFVASVFLYCEYLCYFVVISQCNWPEYQKMNRNTEQSEKTIFAMAIADPHLLGTRNGHWFDKLRREWQMYRSFQTANLVFQPDVFLVLGDLFDEGHVSGKSDFDRYYDRYLEIFRVASDQKILVVPGNHDIGFHYEIIPSAMRSFKSKFGVKSSVEHVQLRQFHFVLLNSMAFENDGCNLCEEAKKSVREIGEKLSNNSIRPIVLLHFPLFRKSDSECSEPDEAPPSEKFQPMREKWEVLSEEATTLIGRSLKPRAVFNGHSHNGCTKWHGEPENFWEYTVSSFSWRNRKNPAFLLVRISEMDVSVSKCMLPDERTIFKIYTMAGIFLVLWVIRFGYLKIFSKRQSRQKVF